MLLRKSSQVLTLLRIYASVGPLRKGIPRARRRLWLPMPPAICNFVCEVGGELPSSHRNLTRPIGNEGLELCSFLDSNRFAASAGSSGVTWEEESARIVGARKLEVGLKGGKMISGATTQTVPILGPGGMEFLSDSCVLFRSIENVAAVEKDARDDVKEFGSMNFEE